MKFRRKAWMAMLCIFIVVSTVLAGCGSSSGGAGTSPGNADSPDAEASVGAASEGNSSPITLSIWVGSWYEDAIPTIQEAYKKEHPNVTLQIEPVPINGYLEKALTAALGGIPPDVIDLDAAMIATMAGRGLLMPLDDYVQDLDQSDFATAIWDSSIYEGQLYAIPNRSSNTVMYYNKTLFDAANVPYPTEDWTYEEMLEKARALTKPDEQQYGLGIAAASSDLLNVMASFAPLVWAMGGDFLNETQDEFILNQPEGVKAIEFWTSLYTKEKVVPEGTISYTISKDLEPMFTNNKLAMFAGGTNNLDNFMSSGNVDFGVIGMPEKYNLGGGYAFAVPREAKQPDAAVEFAKWFVQPEVLSEIAIRQPSRMSAATVPPWNTPEYKIVFDSAPYSKALPVIPEWGEIMSYMIRVLQLALQDEVTPQQAADDITAHANELLKQ